MNSHAAAALLAALLLASCAVRAPSPERFAFAVMGDTPYNEREEARFPRMMERIDAEPVAFVVHVGDFKAGGNSPCTDALFEKRKAQFDASRHPFIYTPGDNEWTACRRWRERAVAERAGDDIRARVVLIRAAPWATRKPVYKDFLAQLQAAAQRLRKTVLFVHGDTHPYRYDLPFLDANGQPIANLKRLEVYGSPIVGWVKVTVDAALPELFTVVPHAQPIVP